MEEKALCKDQLSAGVLMRGRIARLVGLFLLAFCVEAYAKVGVRTTQWDNGVIYVSFDLHDSKCEHTPAQLGISHVDVVWHGATVVAKEWTENNSKLTYKLKQNSSRNPIGYDLFYVICGDTCEPRSETGELIPNGLLSAEEVYQIFERSTKEISFPYMLLLAFLGGLILNIMPCVFPTISLKIYSIAKISANADLQIRKEAGLFASGMFSVFFVLGALLNSVKSTVPNVGWGFYMQEPAFVFALFIVFLACAIHFLGIYHFEIPYFSSKLRKATGTFFSGVLSGIASSSCVGPFVGVALAGAILCTDGVNAYAILFTLCVGVSAPYLLITIFPSLVRHFPRPGAWLNTFQRFMGYTMIASAAWVFFVMLRQIGNENAMKVLLLIIAVVFLLHQLSSMPKSKVWKYANVAGIVILTTIGYNQVTKSLAEQFQWIEYDKEKLDVAMRTEAPVFLNFTADWCLNCKYNETVFDDPQIIDLFKRHKVIAMKCDWTTRKTHIAELLSQYNALAVPLYVFIKGGQSKILPTLLTKKNLIEAIEGKNESKK